MWSPNAYLFRKMAGFDLVSHKSKAEIKPPAENIHGI